MTAHPEFIVGQMRVHTTEPFGYLHVGTHTTMADADKALDALIERLESIVKDEGIHGDGPMVLVCTFGADGVFLEAGYPVREEAMDRSSSHVRTVDGSRCASLLYWGSLDHYVKAHEALMQRIREAGLPYDNQLREWYLHFEGDSSPNNVMLLQYVLAT